MTRRALAPLAVAALLAAPAPGRGQDVAIVGGEVHTVTGGNLAGATVLVRDGRIAAIGPDVTVPDGVPTVDARGKIVTPGLFDPFSSLGLLEVDLVRETRDESMADDEDPVTAAFDPVDGFNPRSTLIPHARLAGITTAVTAPTGGLVAGRAAVVDLLGETVDEMLVLRDAAMFAAYGEAGAARSGGARGAAALRLREVLEDARFWARNRALYDRGDARELAESRLDLAALQPVLEGRVPLVVQAHRASDIRTVLAIAREYGLRPVILGGAEAWLVADELAAADVPVILKPLSSLPSDFEELGARFDNAALLHEAGVRIAFTPFENHRAGDLTQEAGNAIRFGLPRAAAARAITLAPAEIFGVADRYGSLEPGKVGNVVVWSGDPFELDTRAETVVVRGRIVPDRSRQRELFERYRTVGGERPPAWSGGDRGARLGP